MSHSALPPKLRAVNGRHEGVDSGGRKIEPVPEFETGLPNKPDDLDREASSMWDAVCQALKAVDILREIDEYALLVLCETYSRWRESVTMRHERGILDIGIQGKMVKAGWVLVEEASGKELRTLLREFGLSPASVGLLSPSRKLENEVNPFADFSAG